MMQWNRLDDPYEPLPKSKFGRQAFGLAFFMIAIFCAIAGVLSIWHLRTLQRDSASARARVLMRTGTQRPMYLYEFTASDQKFRGTWVGPDQPLHETGDTIDVTYYKPNPRVSNGGDALEPMPLETPKGWFVSAVIAAFCGALLMASVKETSWEYPWS